MKESERHLPALTGLRFLAAVCVLFHHSLGSFGFPLSFKSGFTGFQAVTFFFVLSGFILAYNHSDLSRPGAWRRFWFARWARIWPAHAAVLLAMFALLPRDCRDGGPQPMTALALNLALVQGWVPAWNSFYSYNAVSWSISAEWAFYLCFPLLIANWRRTWWAKLAATFGLAALTLGLCNWLRLPFQVPGKWSASIFGLVYVNPACNLFAFTLGIALVPVLRRLRVKAWGPVAGTGLELLALAAVIYSMFRSFFWSARIIATCCPQLGLAGLQWLAQGNLSLPAFALLIVVMALGRGWCSRLLGHPTMTLLGEISFSLYLVHAPLRRWYLANYASMFSQPNPFAYVGWIALSLGVAYLNWRFVERPCRKLLIGLWSRPAPIPSPAVVPVRRAA